ncbi:protein kinase family protein [Nocardioides sp. TRM66260-LWL]|uniref:protein kinase family protein n=1 Tax=Nocardioides sp. TRM66260-LWL TaxID=2874478 RepID=UPI001CC6DFCB|nr:protein kinase family protein [Nocardioides sp. TRM66260-LWL]MBZ5735569.1 protein kinase family protein [Nocardioides sp. TRM66260-LWL]
MPQSNRPGDVLAGRYRLIDLLSESGGGRFWRAQDDVLERDVALHVIAADDPRADDLLDAARRSAAVLDPRILRVLDADVRDGRCFVVNEWGSGTSLDIMLAAGGHLGSRAAAWLVAEVAEAIAVAHAAGVPHGRLLPEAVLVDRTGSVRVIGLCVDAALHGTGQGRPEDDVADLARLLYAALTGRWSGAPGSGVEPAPREHGRLLRPRQVRAGVARTLDELCGELLCTVPSPSRPRDLRGLSTARGVSDVLRDFIGDPAGLDDLLRSRLVVRGDETVTFSAVPEFAVREPVDPLTAPLEQVLDGAAPTVATPAAPAAADRSAPTEPAEPAGPPPTEAALPAVPEPDVEVTPQPSHPDAPDASSTDLPTEAGLPIFGDDDVSWVAAPGARREPSAPPPPLEDVPARPLFAPTSERRPRPHAVAAAAADPRDFWPFESTGTGVPGLIGPVGPSDEPGEDDEVPGRRWLRVAGALLASLLLLLAVVIVTNLVRGRGPLGEADPAAAADEPTPSASATAAATALTGLSARDFDPEGQPASENPELAPLAVDGDPTTGWRTLTYDQDLGPGGLKSGLGLVVDLGRTRTVESVTLTLTGAPTEVTLYASTTAPTAAPADGAAGLTRLVEQSVDTQATLTPTRAARGRYLLVWLTSLPRVGDGFQGQIDEVAVRGR